MAVIPIRIKSGVVSVLLPCAEPAWSVFKPCRVPCAQDPPSPARQHREACRRACQVGSCAEAAEAASPSSSTHGPAVLSPVPLHFTFCTLPGLSQQLHFVLQPPRRGWG